jgi:hypothetical protein
MGTGLEMTMAELRTPARARLALPLCLALGLVAGCSSDGGDFAREGVTTVGRTVVSRVLSNRQAAAQGGGITATDAELRAFANRLIVVTGLESGVEAVFGAETENGDTIIWKSADNVTLTLRDGALVASRGYGFDLMSAEAPEVRGGQGEVVRDHYYLGGDELIHRHRYFCDLSSPGSERVVVTSVASTARVVLEDCEGEGQRFQNRYWIEPGGFIRKSVQWLGPENGSFQIEHVPQGRAANVAVAAAAPAPAAPGITISE